MSERRFIIETVYRAPQPMKKQAGMDEEVVIFTGRG